jgi:hypothetical protein
MVVSALVIASNPPATESLAAFVEGEQAFPFVVIVEGISDEEARAPPLVRTIILVGACQHAARLAAAGDRYAGYGDIVALDGQPCRGQ